MLRSDDYATGGAGEQDQTVAALEAALGLVTRAGERMAEASCFAEAYYLSNTADRLRVSIAAQRSQAAWERLAKCGADVSKISHERPPKIFS